MNGPLTPAEYEQLRNELADTDDSTGAYDIGLILAAFGGGIMGVILTLLVVL
jgi:hypothetical protein